MKTVLCVDDEVSVLEFVRRTLSSRGYTVHALADPTEVSRLLREEQVDLVVLDVEMPEKSGLDIFDELKRQTPTLPILFITGFPAAFHLDCPEKVRRWQTGFSDGRTDILYKPFALQDLFAKVEDLLGAEEVEVA